ncbi:MAG: thioredoxin family protein, partial [Muribaculaceae bacterium]|nr:thioredoxin family protein [Muribaculaceae bacterium]
GLSIIVIYVALGLIVTILFGASALNELATSAGFNIAFFLLLVLFAISFMGGFELTLPSSWTNKMDSKVDATTGYLSIFFMAFTLVLVSFSCTGPIIGTLLVEAAATSNFISPAVGMFGFALALALPFSLFAMFPTMLKSMPKSGGWMNTVKVVLGFLELALALKFLSVADLAYGWRILDREVFISLWIVIFGLLGVYLLGKLTFPHDDKVEKVGVGRFMLACISLAFAVYMLPGLWGAPLKSISAFAPPISTQDFSLYEGEVSAQVDDYEEGMRLGKQLGKPVLLDFSGYGCVNCRKLEGAVWTDPDVKASIDNDFVLVTLMVDEKRALPEPIKVTEKDGTVRTLRTYGDKWSYLQRSKFGANAQPFHVIVNNEGKPLAPAFVYKEDIPAYKSFLNQGIENYKKK